MASNPVAQEHLERACELLEAGNSREALERLESAHVLDPDSAQIRSYYGLCIGLVDRRFEKSMELCISAAKQEFYNPDLYLNLARLNLAFGFKLEGIRYLRRGQMIDPANGAIANELHELGLREEPVLRFLPRRHPLNRWLGNARSLVRSHREPAAA